LGKLDLTEAEGVAATIAAESTAQLRAAGDLRRGRLANLIADPNLFPDPAFHAGPDGVRFAVRALSNNPTAPGPSIHLGQLKPAPTEGPRQAP
ncbi:MAG: hypothetical protein AAF750_18895, partial [Planctomycetota bacterium]